MVLLGQKVIRVFYTVFEEKGENGVVSGEDFLSAYPRFGVSEDEKKGLACCSHTVRVGWKCQNANWRRLVGIRWRTPLPNSGHPVLFNYSLGTPFWRCIKNYARFAHVIYSSTYIRYVICTAAAVMELHYASTLSTLLRSCTAAAVVARFYGATLWVIVSQRFIKK